MTGRRRERVAQRPQLPPLQIGGQVVQHGVPGQRRFVEGRGVPRMEVGADLGRARFRDLAQDGGRPRRARDRMIDEVGRTQPEPREEALERGQLADVLDLDGVARRTPVVLFGVDRGDDRDGAGHEPSGHASATSGSTRLPRLSFARLRRRLCK